jgi:hypothetical protein
MKNKKVIHSCRSCGIFWGCPLYYSPHKDSKACKKWRPKIKVRKNND